MKRITHYLKSLGAVHIAMMLIGFITACTRPTETFKQIEILRLGPPEYPDTNLQNIGAMRYFSVYGNTDSLFVKSYDLINPKTGEAMYPVSCNYQKAAISLRATANMDSVVQYLDGLPNGQLPNNQRPKDWYGCNLFGAWVIILTDKIGIKHYYVFESYELFPPLRNLCEEFMTVAYEQKSARQDLQSMNTDSLTAYCMDHYLKVELQDILMPPLKSTIKFTPPPINQ